MAYKGYKGCGPKKLGASPMKQTTAQNNARRDAKGGVEPIREERSGGVIRERVDNRYNPDGSVKEPKKSTERRGGGVVKDVFKSTHQHHSDNRFKKKNTSKVINQGKSNEKLRTKIN
jgi:hypothetical protein